MFIYYCLALYIFFGILPSLVWLLYYMAKDLHPEPKRMILRIFLWGAAATIPTLFFQIIFSETLNKFQYLAALYSPEISYYLSLTAPILKWFFVIALTEEIFKFLVVRLFVFNNGALDEPLDIMLYMVVAALGFAALENTLYLFSPIDGLSFEAVFKNTIAISFIRFVGATLLHTLCSAIFGYFMALSFFRGKDQLKLAFTGLFLATALHGLYNFSIMTLASPFNFIVPLIIVAGMSIFIAYDFNEIKKVKSICKI